MNKQNRFYGFSKKLLWLALVMSSSVVHAQAILDLADKPLYMQISAKPALSLALSVEFPTVGGQYREKNYVQSREYLGYYNQNLCYNYTSADGGYFTPYGAASAHGCNKNGFSGNFLNWATSSSIDILRYSLTGGDRVDDINGRTILQRAVMRANFYGSVANFPTKELTNAQALQAMPDSARKKTDGSVHNGVIYIYNCQNRVYFRATAGGSCNTAVDVNLLGTQLATPASASVTQPFFITRVEVCKAPGGVLMDHRTVGGGSKAFPLCEQYPNGNYKPVGKLQRYSNEMRVAAWGYPFNKTYDYAGVLRAPMKYVGPTTYNDDYKNPVDNARKEWDRQTGIFEDNPEGNAQFGRSGVINYLNQFGRTGVFGDYKTYDQTNHLYYEALRYLQGLKPTREAITAIGAGTAGYDGFPISTTWTDPYPAVMGMGATGDYSCFKNYILMIADKNVHRDTFIPGNGRTSSDKGNVPDFVEWTRVTGSFEGNAARPYKDAVAYANHTDADPTTANQTASGNPNPWTAMTNMETVVTGSDNSRHYLAGMAYWANTHDIRGKQWTDYGEASGTGDPRRPGMRVTSYFIDVNEVDGSNTVGQRRNNQFVYGAKYGSFDANRSFGGNPFTADGKSFSDALWQRDATELFPKGYFLASDAQAVLTAFDDIFETIVTNAHNLAGVSASSGYSDSATVGDVMYQAGFDGSNWKGDVTANTVTLNALGKLVFSPVADWSAAAKLDARDWKTRNIIIGQSLGGGKYDAADFEWSSLTSDQKDLFMGDLDASIAHKLIEFIKGDRLLEGTTIKKDVSFRLRGSRLGDMVNSGTVYKGKPRGVNFDAEYTAFYEAHKDRTGVVYVGANDGMLHAFNAVSAEELFAYIPSFVVKDLPLLPQSDYEHRSYVDATPTVAEAKVSGAWKTVLVGGAGAGGQGVYALDVTNPGSFNKDRFLWEFTDQDDKDLGNVMGTPQIVRIPSKNSDGFIIYNWYAVVPGGVNNTVADGAVSRTGKPAVFILDLSKSASAKWVEGSNYFKVSLPPIASRAQGVINIRVVADSRSTLQSIYAGDLSGQVWRINLSKTPSEWKSTSPFKLFQAPAGQSISMPVQVTTDMIRSYVTFGTGKYLEESDNKAPFKTQTLYAMMDVGEEVKFSHLAQLNATADKKFEGMGAPWGTPTQAGSGSLRAGWYANLPGSGTTGERMAYGMTIRNGMIVANSLLPVGGGCIVGDSRQYAINIFSGLGGFQDVSNQLLGSVFLVNGDANTFVDPNTGNTVVIGDSHIGNTGTKPPGDSGLDLPAGSMIKQLLDWRDLNNYGQVKNESF